MEIRVINAAGVSEEQVNAIKEMVAPLVKALEQGVPPEDLLGFEGAAYLGITAEALEEETEPLSDEEQAELQEYLEIAARGGQRYWQ